MGSSSRRFSSAEAPTAPAAAHGRPSSPLRCRPRLSEDGAACPAGTSHGRLPLAPACCPAGRGWMALGGPLQLLLLLLLPLPLPGLAEPEATVEGRVLPALHPQEAPSPAFTCLAAAPSLAWYLNGERQGESDGSGRLMATGNGDAFEEGSSSTFVVTTRRLHRPLNCSATDPVTGRVSSASVLLNVQFKPEFVKVGARYEEGSREPGLLLVLFVLVRANPPASITWVDQDGQVMVNTSSFLIVDTKTYPWLTNHTVQLQLSSRAQNISLRAANSSVLLPGFLDARIELPLLALVVGGGRRPGDAAVPRRTHRQSGLPEGQGCSSSANNLEPAGAQLPRANLSLPANLQLNDLAPKARGLGHIPMVGHIYRASSMSSDEIWL
ncbi:hypothetical protein lerEdw1_010057 [Lerista edwardsae]|nr:hypothetical protein lerEdw1_010057 [Lerista edwardsae]